MTVLKLTAAAIAMAAAISTSVAADEMSPVFGTASATVLSKADAKNVVGKGYYSDYYGYYGNLYSSYASSYGSIGYSYDDYDTEYYYYYYAYYYGYYAYANYYYAYLYSGS